MLVSNVLFETDQASLFRIPRGEVSLANWNPTDTVWNGCLRLIEEEETDVSDDSQACLALRLKIELYTAPTGSEPRSPWAEVWYNPFSDNNLNYTICNDGSESVVMTPESAKYYRLVLQLPNSGYHPVEKDSNDQSTDKDFDPKKFNSKRSDSKKSGGSNASSKSDPKDSKTDTTSGPKSDSIDPQRFDPNSARLCASDEKGDSVLQVALGLQFHNTFTAYSFSESLSIYKRHFRNFQEKFIYERHLSGLQQRIKDDLGLSPAETHSPTPVSDFDDDEFGSFVGSSYD